MNSSALHEVLKTIKYPGFSRDIVSFGLVRSAEVVEGRALVKLAISTADATIPQQIKRAIEQAVPQIPGVRDVVVEIAVSQARPPAGPEAAPPAGMPGVRHIVAVASGKGGVGKSTVAVNLACALARTLGAGRESPVVGLMDIDIYGPSVPLMMGLHGRPQIDGEELMPLERFGVRVMSMGFLIDADTPVIWRGPMVMKAIQQFVQNVHWGELEVLVVDLPPGTGDAQLSLVQTIPLSGAVLVTTPQLAATQVARRGGLMFSKVNVPLLGVVENMSYFEQNDGTRSHVFGQGGGESTAAALGTRVLGQIPILEAIRAGGDAGEPIVVREPYGAAAKAFNEVSNCLLQVLQAQNR